MTRINQIGYSTMYNGLNLYTKRTCSDNSDIYISSKLRAICDQTIAGKNMYSSKRNLRKLVEGNHLDETI